jgi:4-carboxymuconolactone decarboxylase
MTVLQMDPSKLSAAGRALFAAMAAKRKTRGEGFGGPYTALLNHPELARRIEELGFFLKFEGVLPRPAYQFIVLTVAHATGAAFEWHDHVEHALAAGLPRDVVDAIGAGRTDTLPAPYDLLGAILAKTMAWQPVPDDLQARRRAMGHGRTGRDRRGVRILPDVRRDQSRLRHQAAALTAKQVARTHSADFGFAI